MFTTLRTSTFIVPVAVVALSVSWSLVSSAEAGITLVSGSESLTSTTNSSAKALAMSPVTTEAADGQVKLQFAPFPKDTQSLPVQTRTYRFEFDFLVKDDMEGLQMMLAQAGNDKWPIVNAYSDFDDVLNEDEWYRAQVDFDVVNDSGNSSGVTASIVVGDFHEERLDTDPGVVDDTLIWVDNIQLTDITDPANPVVELPLVTYEQDTIGLPPSSPVGQNSLGDSITQSEGTGTTDVFEVVAVPEPASLALLGAGGLLALSRRRAE